MVATGQGSQAMARELVVMLTAEGKPGAGVVGSSTALNAMLAQPWGTVAVANTQVLGVNASAIAATCVLESGCQNIAAASGSTVSGAFQMTKRRTHLI